MELGECLTQNWVFLLQLAFVMASQTARKNQQGQREILPCIGEAVGKREEGKVECRSAMHLQACSDSAHLSRHTGHDR